MTDDRRRELERKAQAGDHDARAALLAHRVRAGELTRQRVGLAAWLGDEAAQEVCLRGLRDWVPGANLSGLPAIPVGGLEEFAGEVARWGVPAAVVAGCALGAVAMQDRTHRWGVLTLQAARRWATTEDPQDHERSLAAWRKARNEHAEGIVLHATALLLYQKDSRTHLRSLARRAQYRVNRSQLFDAAKGRLMQWALA